MWEFVPKFLENELWLDKFNKNGGALPDKEQHKFHFAKKNFN